ncbi:MAG TPA: ABC transporter ATP-binding protein [Planctomycetaceae bacterium]|nr:ABC transporter ATP-binding protein [Planctomycetaceae bacterium]HCD02460.1 ABC transporter ATP-binding protein [Planctomycetaceae bacterium]|tara:strand:+ start:3760 stop:4428 length:669 start_codon:yes stop_codon:yes gene_type:complete
MLISLDHITKTYTGDTGPIVAVDDVSVSVEAGEFVAVVGPSGCGKTTLLLVAGGLLRPEDGEVNIDGTDPYSLSGEQRARFRAEQIGFVFQQFHLVPYLNVLDNVMAPALVTGETSARERAETLVERFGLTDRLGHRPGQLSTGERQRVALARALLNEPRVILADEPTGNLDGDNSEQVLQALKAFTDEGGAVLLVTHDPDAVAFAGRQVMLQGGQLAQSVS